MKDKIYLVLCHSRYEEDNSLSIVGAFISQAAAKKELENSVYYKLHPDWFTIDEVEVQE